MESSLTSRIFIPKKIINPIKFKLKSPKILISKISSTKKNKFKILDQELNTSWDFTPFPDLYFPSEKNKIIRNINKLNFKASFRTPENTENKKNLRDIFKINSKKFKKSCSNKIYTNLMETQRISKNNSMSYLFKENCGDITKYSSPAYSFGISREDCKFPFLQNSEKISPTPCSYTLRPLEGLGGSSLKYSINKDFLLKRFRKRIEPGPGYYNMDKCDIKNNGNIVLSDIKNTRIANFAKYEERKDKIGKNNEWNIKPDPFSYNINNILTMFNGSGKYPISKFRSNISKSIDKYRGLSRGRIKFIYPGPGDYNHYSTFRKIY